MAKTLDNMQSGKILKVSWNFTVSPFSGPKHAQTSKSLFVKAWKFSGLEDAYAYIENPTPNEDSTTFLLKDWSLKFSGDVFQQNYSYTHMDSHSFIHKSEISYLHEEITRDVLIRGVSKSFEGSTMPESPLAMLLSPFGSGFWKFSIFPCSKEECASLTWHAAYIDFFISAGFLNCLPGNKLNIVNRWSKILKRNNNPWSCDPNLHGKIYDTRSVNIL